MPACGLDFGTSNSALALPDGTVLPVDPAARGGADPRLLRSVLFFPQDGAEVFAGAEAIERYLDEGEGRFIQSVKSWLPSAAFRATNIRSRTFLLEELVAIVVRRLREAAMKVAGPLDEVVMGRPAVFSTEPEADALAEGRLRRAAELAGFTKVRFVIEPIAAALAYESQLSREETVLVADFGAGTSDVTVMRLGPGRGASTDRKGDILASGGVYIGGDRFDAEIMRHKLLSRFGAASTYMSLTRRQPMPPDLMNKLLAWHRLSFIKDRGTLELLGRMLHTSDDVPAIRALKDLVVHNLGYHVFRAIEAAKVRLSTETKAVIEFTDGEIRLEEPLTRAELERFAAPLLAGLGKCVDDVHARAGSVLVDSVFLTGGSSQMPAVRRLFEERFGPERVRTRDAFSSVAEGLGRAVKSFHSQ